MPSCTHCLRTLSVAALVVAVPRLENAVAGSPNRFKAAIEASRSAFTATMKRGKVPGMSVAVAVGGDVVWAEGFGYADLEQQVAVTPKTKFGIGSITKPLTLACVGRLVDRDMIALDEPIERYIRKFPHSGKGITIRLIAGHMSGMNDDFSASGKHSMEHYDTTADALKYIAAEPLRSEPGTEFFYATGTFTTIAAAIEKVTRSTFLQAMDEYVIRPLDLTDVVPNDRRGIVPHRAAFYAPGDDGAPVNAAYFDPSYKWAGAGYLATPRDLVRFGSAMLKPGFLTKETLAEIFRPLETPDGKSTGYALGWRVEKDTEGRTTYHYPGGGPGISCWIVLIPEAEMAVAILTNLTAAPVGGRALNTVLDSFLAAVSPD